MLNKYIFQNKFRSDEFCFTIRAKTEMVVCEKQLSGKWLMKYVKVDDLILVKSTGYFEYATQKKFNAEWKRIEVNDGA